MDTNYTGAHNAGRPLLLDSALEWVQMSLSSKDMDHRETMLTNARFIAACYGTPPQLVNIPGESTYSNYQQATMAYWGDTVLPLLGILLEDINRWLPALFGEKVFLWYDEEQIPALEPRRRLKNPTGSTVPVHDLRTRSARRWGWKPMSRRPSRAPTACSSRPITIPDRDGRHGRSEPAPDAGRAKTPGARTLAGRRPPIPQKPRETGKNNQRTRE